MNSQTKKGTASGNKKQQKNKCNPQDNNESKDGLGFDVKWHHIVCQQVRSKGLFGE